LSKKLKNKELVRAPGGVFLIKHAALLHDVGKPQVKSEDDKGIHFYGHEKKGAEMVSSISARLGFSTSWQKYVSFVVLHHLRPLYLYKAANEGRSKSEARTRFFIRTDPHTTDILLLSTADMLGKEKAEGISGFEAFARETVEAYSDSFLPESRNPRLLNGHDLMVIFGLKPSPAFSEIIGRIELQRLSGRVTNREEALKAAKDFINSKKLS
jgi:poly(A) polymerase